MESIGIVLSTIAANMRTEDLLKQSQLLTSELQAQQGGVEEDQRSPGTAGRVPRDNRRSCCAPSRRNCSRPTPSCKEKAHLLSVQNQQVEAKNREVEQAKIALEDKAEQLALTSKFKSEFLANMSHELRTPLNSLLILSKLLADNTQGKPVGQARSEFAANIHAAGTDLLGLINDVLDLAKIESGTVTLDISEMSFASLRDQVDRTFSLVAADKKLDFQVELDPALPRSMYTDDKRLQQIIKNLLSNAFKFTEKGHVKLKVGRAHGGWNTSNDHLNTAGQVLAFEVEDSGIGIPEEKQRIIFESFQQADGTTSRKYGGTGLGLSISREIAGMLGGELRVTSTIGKGSVFTLYLPLNFFSPARRRRPPAVRLRPRWRPRPMIMPSSFSEEPAEAVADDRDLIGSEDKRGADRRGRSPIRLDPAQPGARKRFQGRGDRRGGGRAVARPPLWSRRHHAGHRPAGHGRPGAARSPEAARRRRGKPSVHVISADDQKGPGPVHGRLRVHP